MELDPELVRYKSNRGKEENPFESALKIGVGEYECLSNSHRCKIYLPEDADPYPSVEHAFQASKTSDTSIRSNIRDAANAIESKKISRSIPLTDKWREASESIMLAILRDKFRRHKKYREKLVSTGQETLAFINDYSDRIWGVYKGKGENKLGTLLMLIRSDIVADRDTIEWIKSFHCLEDNSKIRLHLTIFKEGKVIDRPIIEGKSVVQVGKLSTNELQLEHMSISRKHSLLFVTTTDVKLVCLDAPNGTYLNGERLVPFVPATVGDDSSSRQTFWFGASKRRFQVENIDRNLEQIEKAKLIQQVIDPSSELNTSETVYVGNFPAHFSEEKLRDIFSSCGKVVRISMPKMQSLERRFAFITFATLTEVSRALAMDKDEIGGKEIRVRRVSAEKEKSKTSVKRHKETNDASAKKRVTIELEATKRMIDREVKPFAPASNAISVDSRKEKSLQRPESRDKAKYVSRDQSRSSEKYKRKRPDNDSYTERSKRK